MSYYLVEEIHDAMIIDSEALLYGYVCGDELRDEKPVIKACIKLSVHDTVPDTELLRKMLTEAGYTVPEDATLEYLVLAARSEGLEIPYREVTEPHVLVKGFVSVDEIEVIDTVYDLGREEQVAVVLLRSPREARYRGRPVARQETPPPVSPKHVKGKLVVDKRRGVLGYAEAISYGPGSYALRIGGELVHEGYINWDGYLAELRSRGWDKLAKLLSDMYSETRYARLPISLYNYIRWILLENKAGEAAALLARYVEAEKWSLLEETINVPWPNVVRIGDVIITDTGGAT